MACHPQLLVGLTIVASEKTTLTTCEAVRFTTDRPDLLRLSQSRDGINCVLTPIGPLGVATVKFGWNTVKVTIIAGSPASIEITGGI